MVYAHICLVCVCRRTPGDLFRFSLPNSLGTESVTELGKLVELVTGILSREPPVSTPIALRLWDSVTRSSFYEGLHASSILNPRPSLKTSNIIFNDIMTGIQSLFYQAKTTRKVIYELP